MHQQQRANDRSDREIVLTRIVDAPRELVFDVWTDPRHIVQWWGPRGYTNTSHEMDARPGGVWRYTMHGPDGVDYQNKIVYTEVDRPRRIAYDHSDDAPGATFAFRVTVTFDELAPPGQSRQTRVTLRTVFDSVEECRKMMEFGAVDGGIQTLDRLADHVAGLSNSPPPSDVLITRVIDAPREVVFKAWTDPSQLPRWYAPRGCTVMFKRLDVRAGGGFHSCIRSADGHECWCTGDYREVVSPERIVHTMVMADAQGRPIDPATVGMDPQWPRETLLTVTFAEQGGVAGEPRKTFLTLRQSVDQTLAQRTGAYPSWLDILDRLASEVHRA